MGRAGQSTDFRTAADVSAEAEPDGADPVAGRTGGGPAPAPAEMSVLIAEAVQRIAADAVRLRAEAEPVVAANLPVPADEWPPEPVVAPGVVEPDIALPAEPARDAVASEPSPPEGEVRPIEAVAANASDTSLPDLAAPDFSYVPAVEDRAGGPVVAPPEPVRIEPTFDPSEPAAAVPAASALDTDFERAIDVALPDPVAASAPSALRMETAQEDVASATVAASAPRRLTVRRVAKLAALLFGGYLAVVLALILLYRFVPPPTSALMAYQWLAGTEIRRTWVPIEDISPNLLRAVVVSEDWGFCKHYGIDFDAIEQALEKAGDGVPRGASTISMQVIKNLFLTQSKSYIRKAIELPLTVVAEAVWPKSRMLEIYLNIAEWGPGVFGAEAAAQHHFAKPAARLSEREAALLAASLPNPMIRDAGDPGPRTARKASVIQSRMRVAGPVADCAMPPRTAPNPGQSWEPTVKKRAGAPPGL